MATPTESQILTNYLLLPADLRSVITPDKFAALFPRALQASPNVQTLYRDLEQQRADAVETVRANIEAETKRGYRIRNEVAKARRREREGNGEIDDEIEIERALFGASTDAVNSRHTLSSIVPELNAAVADLESQIKALEDEERATIASLQKTVGTMSDLRYGELENKNLPQDVQEALDALTARCNEITQ